MAVVALGYTDHAETVGVLTTQMLEVSQPAAHLERTGGCVILVLEPHHGAERSCKLRPYVRRGRHCAIHYAGRGLDGVAIWEFSHACTLRPLTQYCASTVDTIVSTTGLNVQAAQLADQSCT